MKIIIRHEKEEIPIEINSTETVKDLKLKIANLKNCKISEVRLIYNASILKNSQKIESFYVDPRKPINLYILESRNKTTKQPKTQSSTSNIVDQSVEFVDYFLRPKMKESLRDPDVQIGLGMIKQGLSMCHDSGNNYYNDQLNNLKYIYHDPSMPTPPPSQSNSLNSIHQSACDENQDVDTEKNEKSEQDTEYYKNLYNDQLREMEDMGFQDEAANLEALIKTNGDLDDAVMIIIGQT